MRDGFIKVGAATPELRVADTVFNADRISAVMAEAAAAGVKILVLPELCVTGYTCGDLFLQDELLRGAERAVAYIASQSAEYEMLTFVGAPVRCGGALYNCAITLWHGRLLAAIPKHHLPEYGEFYEKRWFTPAPDSPTVISYAGAQLPLDKGALFRLYEGCVVGVELCEDLWVPDTPSVELAKRGATVICNLSASNEIIGKADYRRMLVRSKSAALVAGYIYADAGSGESTTDMVFAGHNMIAENGSILAESRLFDDGLIISELDTQRLINERRRMHSYAELQQPSAFIDVPVSFTQTRLTRHITPHPFVPHDDAELAGRCESILDMQAAGLAKRLKHTCARTAVVGISGGLDSSLALIVAARALDRLDRSRSELIAVTMPCFGTTQRTKSNAERLSELIGANLMHVDITAAVRQHFRDIGQDESVTDVTYENSQARERTQVIMDIANRTGGLVVGTGDLSELALGWATYNGDHMSMYGVNASVPKTLVRYIVRHYAHACGDDELRDVLLDILATPVSPELLPAKDGEIAQVTEDLVGPYELHDFFLYHALRWGAPPAKVFRLARYAFDGAYDDATILKWLRTFYRRFFAQQFKRSCLPDGPKVGSVALSPRGDLRMPSDACAALWLSEVDSIKLD